MKVALCQIDVIAGNIDQNLSTMIQAMDEAHRAGASLAIFPEMSVTGYLLGDLWNNPDFLEDAARADAQILSASGEMAVVYGTVIVDPSKRNKDGRVRKYNGVRVIQNGKLCGQAIKTLLPNYRVFDDSRYFFSGLDLALEEGKSLKDYLVPLGLSLDGKYVRLGLEVCEDLWHGDYMAGGEPINVTGYLLEQGADILVNCSASPWTLNKNNARHRRVQAAMTANTRDCPFIYVNCTGAQNNGKNFVTFDGRSTVYDAKGAIKFWIPQAYEQKVALVDLALLDGLAEIIPPEEQRAASQFQAIVRAIKGLDDLMGRSNWPAIIGLSGGVDSAVSICLLEQALGSHRIRAYNLPSTYNSDRTKGIAARLAQDLGVQLETIDIESLVQANTSLLENYEPQELHRENIQAKIRGTSILSNLAGILGGLMINNGNKVEVALGYATLYGDINGALAPLGDLTKVDVFNLARYLNDHVYHKEVIPSSLLPDEAFDFVMPPSAELKSNQRDPMKWGYHDVLVDRVCNYQPLGMIEIGRLYLDGKLWSTLNIPPRLVAKYDLYDPEIFVKDLEWFFRLFALGVFKRIQAPPLVITTRSAFGYDHREAQIPYKPGIGWTAIREEILRVRK